ncbi:putative C-type lectin domain family 20 member A [Clarias gariepinus]|uniref:putative C-type lectin domain family 20 member A n=1 Tax=Clarias gariepinus TaxID=13013 RepID=UPI00234CC641|nr:putative C-type lectin domain family 20 member A [Clarias gariepinus]
MKLNIFLFLCLSGLAPVAVSILLTIPHRYELIPTRLTWASAQTYCKAKYTDLAITLSDTDWLRVKTVAGRKGLATGASMFVGLWNDVNSWRWSLYDLSLNIANYTNWYAGQPDNLSGNQACVAIITLNQWFDQPCTDLRPFICYDVNFSGKFISITSPLLTWLDARTYCRQHHTDLASSLSSSDQDIIDQLAATSNSPWIGLYRDTWKWSDGSNATNIKWTPGEPNNAGTNDNCAAFRNGLIIDASCSITFYFFCHTFYPTRSQIIRLQVEYDGSVFDPAVQSIILNQIKQKLKENGMLENTTVTWSVQPDGNIFHLKK